MRHWSYALAALCLIVPNLQTALAQGSGSILGSVFDADTRESLPGANVIVEGTLVGTATDAEGRFVLTRVPVGPTRLLVTYLGYEDAALEVSVEPGAVAPVTFELKVASIRGEEVLVLGFRAQGQAKALNQQRNAPNITNVVASDQIGRFPDASAPDALQRIPGVGVQRDQGEGRFIQIRGAAPQLTTIMLNGERIPSPEGDVRQIALDAIPTEILESIEVAKAITPDMDADAIGGSVNLVTRRASLERRLSIDAAGGYGASREKGSARGSATLSGRSDSGKLGYVVNGSVNRRQFGSDDVEPSWDFGDDEVPLGGDDELEEMDVRYYDLMRQRIGANTMLDYRISNQSTLFARGLFVQLQDTEQRHRLTHVPADNELVYLHKNRTEFLRTIGGMVGGEHLLGNGIQVDYQLSVARSQENTPNDTEIGWVQEDVSFDPDFSDPDNIQPNPQIGSIDDTSAFEFDSVEPASSNTTDDDFVGALNVSVPIALGSASGNLKLGAKYRLKEKFQDVSEKALELTDDVDEIVLGVDVGVPFSDRYDVGRFQPGRYALPSFIMRDKETPDFEERFGSSLEADDAAPLEGNLEDFEATERTMAGYVMTELNLSPQLMVLPGVRYERTALESVGYKSVFEEEIDDGDLKTEIVDVERTAAKNQYGYLFPMVHVRYRATPNTNMRAAFTTALARPNFFDLAPYEIRDDDELEVGNPDLTPSRSKNFDLMFEQYTTAIGIVSAGAFYKKIDDPIVTFRSEFERIYQGETFDITQFQQRNGESGFIWGLEFALQQQLRFLPGALGGLGISANYTYTQSEAVLSDGSKNVYPGQAENIFNAAMSYENKGFSGQISLNYTGEFLDEFAGDGLTADRSNDIFVRDRWGLDFSASLQLRSGLGFFVEWVNLLNAPLSLYQGDPSRPIQREYYRSWGWVGVRYAL